MGLKLMCVAAHPDDECFAFGGALALAAERGVETYMVILTDGQAASYRGNAVNSAGLALMRREEFAASCKVLGITHHEVLDYQDGQLEFANFSQAVHKLVERMRRYQPHVILTFGGDGALNIHADHTLVSAFTTAAFHWSGRPKRFPDAGPVFQPQRLFYQTTNHFLPGRQAPLPMPWTLTLDIRSVMDKKLEAFRQHTTQAPLLSQVEPVFRAQGQTEHYTLAATRDPQAARQSTDMFEGIIL